jgi:hypothetical protein
VATLPGFGCVTLGVDNVHDAQAFVRELRDHSLTPHVAQKPVTAIDRRTSRHLGYALNQGRRKPSRGSFRVAQTVALLRKTRYRGVARVGWMFTFAAAAFNLVRMRTLTMVLIELNRSAAGRRGLTRPSPACQLQMIIESWKQRNSRLLGLCCMHPLHLLETC